ncbi:MAG: SpoIIE family protein phosphatase [Erysipelotrichaceae bacterium]|nr:SpoIIE family protein phosphatase [Erysipelotrichaceae bacterium]
MVQRTKDSILKRIEEEFVRTTDTLWENEIQANLFVARVLLGTALIDLVFIVLATSDVLLVDKESTMSVLYQALVELIVPALICLKLKGERKWLKIVMLIEYTIVLARVESVLMHNVVLLIVFPVVLSIRYYSRPVTSFTAILTILLSGFADYAGVVWKMGRLNLNMVELPIGTVLHFNDTTSLRDVIMSQASIDYQQVWLHTLQHYYMPKLILFAMISTICTEIAKRGRLAIFAQQEETAQSERIKTELNIASDIQANMLPNIFPAFPERNDFDIYATMNPAREVGGDFYDFFMVDDDHLAMVIADVSGKGTPAALFMVISKTLIKDHAQLGLSPGDVFTRVNRKLCDGNESGYFVTAWMGILDVRNGELTYVNAGHNPPVMKLDGETKFLQCRPQFVLAGFENFQYREEKITLHEGDRIFLYTDGATEAFNAKGELYGENRLIECLKQQSGKPIDEVLNNVKADIYDFAKGTQQSDDLTLLAFDYKRGGVMEREFEANDSRLHEVLAFLEEELEKHDAGMKETMALTLAMEEAFVNVAHYAYEGRPEPGKAWVCLSFDNDEVTITLKDKGMPFDPLAMEDPNINASAEERGIGGLGIYMIKKSTDSVDYKRIGDMNILTMKKVIRNAG